MSPARDPDHAIARTARHGIITRAELYALGIDDDALGHRVSVGRLHRLYRGVYAVGHTSLTREGRWLAAVLACGPRAVLSHSDAAALWGFGTTRGARYDVTIRSRAGRTPPRVIRPHRVGTMLDDEVTEHERIPVTTPARTILDEAKRVRGRKMEDMIAAADRLELFDLRSIERLLNRHPRVPGAPALKLLLADLRGAGPARYRSPGEIAVAQLCDDYKLPAPIINEDVLGYEVDAQWPGTTLIVEADGYDFHRMPSAFADDRDRDQVLMLAGYTVVRFTKAQLEGANRAESARRLASLLRRCGSRTGE
jgi:hypothetical protein